MSKVVSKLSCVVATVGFCLALASTAQATTVTWDNGAADMAWGVSQGGPNTNWDADVTPSTGDDVDITTGDTVNYGSAIYGVGTELLDLDLTGAGTTLNISADMHIGNGTGANPFVPAIGTIVGQTAGTVDLDSSNGFQGILLGGTYNLSGGSLVTDSRIAITTGTLNLSGAGAVDNNGDLLHFTGSSSGLFNFTGGTLESNGGPWFGGQFAFAGLSGGLVYDVTGGSSITVGNGSANAMILSVLGAPSINTIASNGVDLIVDGVDGVFEATINSTSDVFLQVTEGGDIALAGTLNVTNLSGSEYGEYDILSVVGGSITGDFTTFSLPSGWEVFDNGSADGTYTIGQTAPVPEPSTAMLLVIGCLIPMMRRRKR